VSNFNLSINEIVNNNPLSNNNITEMSYYIRQTFERYSMMVTEGYIEAEFAFCEEGDSTTTKTFDPSKEDHVSYADTHI
jgi:hypothetical protein